MWYFIHFTFGWGYCPWNHLSFSKHYFPSIRHSRSSWDLLRPSPVKIPYFLDPLSYSFSVHTLIWENHTLPKLEYIRRTFPVSLCTSENTSIEGDHVIYSRAEGRVQGWKPSSSEYRSPCPTVPSWLLRLLRIHLRHVTCFSFRIFSEFPVLGNYSTICLSTTCFHCLSRRPLTELSNSNFVPSFLVILLFYFLIIFFSIIFFLFSFPECQFFILNCTSL